MKDKGVHYEMEYEGSRNANTSTDKQKYHTREI